MGQFMPSPRTLYDKIWHNHLVSDAESGSGLIYIDRHLVHEVTSPQAFEKLASQGIPVRRPEAALAVADHNIPTVGRAEGITDELARLQVDMLRRNVMRTNIPYYDVDDVRQGIVHVIGPEQGFTQPGLTIVCGDSHTSTHGAFGALAFGIGTSEVEHVLATQTLTLKKAKNMRVTVSGTLPLGVTAKDMALAIIGEIGTNGGTGHVIEFAGEAVEALSMEARMTLCNMAIEAGARSGLIAPDETTFSYLKGRPFSPKAGQWEQAITLWSQLSSDPEAKFDREVQLEASQIAPQVTWGTNPEQVLAITGLVPDPATIADKGKREAAERALAYMDLTPGMPLSEIAVSHVFIGSCTNSRIEDLRAAAEVLRGRKVADSVTQAMVVPGSGLVKMMAEDEGLDRIFLDAGFEWRDPGCSMCLAMNPDKVPPGARCASTSNRNFVGRQGPGSRTHLLSPAMAAAAAVTGHLTDIRGFSAVEGE